MLICSQCQAVQAAANKQWFEEIGEIYDSYYAYHQAAGVEQAVPDPSTGDLRRRSDLLLSRINSVPDVPKSGKVLDIGCGTGGTLRAFAKRGGWRLYGLEIDQKNLPFLEQIEGFESLYTCAPADVPGRFDFVTMVHALEHFADPFATVRDLRQKVAEGGYLFIEVPNAEANPFDYVIADHLMHFTPATLTRLLSNAELDITHISTDWISKEISIIAQPGSRACNVVDQGSTHDVQRQLQWLHRLVSLASQAMATSVNFGVFGTSIAATWLYGILGERVSFFVEEDASRIGRSHMGRPIIAPEEIQPGSTVFMALTPQVANQIAPRLPTESIEIILPPHLDAQNSEAC